MNGNSNANSSRPMAAASTSSARLTTRTDIGMPVVLGSTPRRIWYAELTAGADDMDMIKLSVPGTLLFRDVVLRVAASTCRLARAMACSNQEQEPSREDHGFDDKVVSAVGEAFNNIAIHAYRGSAVGTVQLEFELHTDGVTIRLLDDGFSFEPGEKHIPDLSTLPESRMGLYIMSSCMDEVDYQRGAPPAVPNVLTLTKRYSP